jgi:glutamate carboxypeptidase
MPTKRSSALLKSLTSELPQMKATLRRYVECESPSCAPEAINSLATLIASDFAALGGKVRLHKSKTHGPALQVDFAGARRKPHLLLLGHMDTVYPLGTLRTMPWRERAGKLSGPGIFDMKAGIVQALFALKALLAVGALPTTITLLLVPDEEIGSPLSRPLTERLAKKASAVLVLEPAAGEDGACKTSRKGVARYTLRVHGHAAHAGLDFERGASAIVEAAHQVLTLSALSRPREGLTLNAGLISGGTRPNVVADLAEVTFDVRFTRASQAAKIERAMRGLKAKNSRCSIEVSGGVERGCFERSKATAQLYRTAAKAAERLGFALGEAAVGGASDGNLTSAMGIPTLDGLGGVGDGAHAAHEFVIARELPRRAALLAELISDLVDGIN